MTGKYATETQVSIEKSRLEIEQTLRRYKADAFGYQHDGRRVRIAFRLAERHYRIDLTLPDPDEERFRFVMKGMQGLQPRSETSRANAYDQACRSLWRSLALIIKAKLEAVAAGIVSVEDEFLAHMVMPNRETVGEWIRPQMDEAYRVGAMPKPLMIEGPAT